jgi:hypothetical protein
LPKKQLDDLELEVKPRTIDDILSKKEMEEIAKVVESCMVETFGNVTAWVYRKGIYEKIKGCRTRSEAKYVIDAFGEEIKPVLGDVQDYIERIKANIDDIAPYMEKERKTRDEYTTENT